MIVFEGITDDAKSLHYLIKNGAGKRKVFIQDPNDKEKRVAIRYATNQSTIFVEKQSGDVITPAIVMSEGYLKVSKENDPMLLEFLRLSPQNGVNFREVDPEADAAAALEMKELVLDIQAEIRAMSKKGVEGAAKLSSLLLIKSRNSDNSDMYTPEGIDRMGPSQISSILYTMAENSPELFINDKGEVNCFDNNDFVRQDIVIRAVKAGIIRVTRTGREIFWDSGELLVEVPLNKRYRQFLADYFLTDEGEKVMHDIAQAL